MFGCCSSSAKRHEDFCKKFKIKTENRGDSFVITFTGKKEDIAKLDKKHKAMIELCCDGDECC